MIGLAIVALLGAAAPGPLQRDTTARWVADRQIETFNRRDIDGFMALYADDAVVAEFPSGKVLMTGKAEIRKHYATAMKANNIPPVRVDPRVIDGSFVVDHEVWDAKPGERGAAVWMYEIRGGLIRKAWSVRM